MSASNAKTTTIEISRDTFEAWRRGEKILDARYIHDFDHYCLEETDFIDVSPRTGAAKRSYSDELPASELLRTHLSNVNDDDVRRDLIHVIHRYRVEKRRWIPDSGRDGSYAFFLRSYLCIDAGAIQRRFAKEEYVDQEEWEWMKDEDDYSLVLQNPYLTVDYEGDNVKIVLWGL